MRHEIIHHEDYLLIIGSQQFKIGDWVYNQIDDVMYESDDIILRANYEHKIIAHLPLNGNEKLARVPLLPPLEDNIEVICEEALKKYPFTLQSLEKTDKLLKAIESELPTAFEVEENQHFEADKAKRKSIDNGVYYLPKTIINPDGNTQWVGKYIYSHE